MMLHLAAIAGHATVVTPSLRGGVEIACGCHPSMREGAMKLARRRFLHVAAGATTLPATQQIAKAQQTTPVQAALDPLVWPVVTRVPAEVRTFAGHSNTVPDIVGRFGAPASLVIFVHSQRIAVAHWLSARA